MPREVTGIGKWGEDQAAAFLGRNGFKIIERNYNSIVGEIDIVARKGGDLYFVEVKTRSLGPFAYDLAVTRDKMRKMNKTILHYSSRRNVSEFGLVPCSLLVVVDKVRKYLKFRLSVLY